MMTRLLTLLLAAAALVGCESIPPRAEKASPPKAELRFVDLPGFDQTLTDALRAPLPQVKVAFYDRITPSALPGRLQAWLAAVEAGGGTVSLAVIEPSSLPPGALGFSPVSLIKVLSTLWSASKMAREMAVQRQFEAAHAYDASILLRNDTLGNATVDTVVFVQRAK